MKLINTNNGWSVYATSVNHLQNGFKYIYAVVYSGNSPIVPPIVNLNDLDWASIQTRSSDKQEDGVPVITFVVGEQQKQALSDLLTVKDRTDDHTEYTTTQLNILVKILHAK